MPTRRIGLCIAAVTASATVLTISPAAALQDAAPTTTSATQTSAPDKPKTHTVATTDLVLSLDRDGRIDSIDRVKVRLLPEAYAGSFEVIEVVKSGGRVRKGDVLLRFDPEPLEKALDDARINVDHAQRRLTIAQAEQKVLQEDNATRLEQSQKARERAQKELEIWDKYDGPDMLRQAELGLQQREFSLADQKQELAQLEEMYSGTHLAQETTDIVLDRARRGVMMSEEYLKLAKNDDVISRQYRHPMQDMQVRDGVKWSMEDEAHAKVSVVTSEDRKSMELEGAQRALKDAQERLADLEADKALLEVKAPADGVMTTIDLDAKDTVNARQAICEVLDPSQLVVKFAAHPEDLRVLAPVGGLEGEAVKKIALRLPEFPEVKLTGTIMEMAEMVSAGGGGAEANTIPVTVKIEGASNPLVRLGLKCKVHAERTLPDVLAIPKGAVKWEAGEAKVKVANGDGTPEERTIVVGPANDTMIMVVDGLKAGDRVVADVTK
jgi:multidrug efflux pump subunit AcrA (membrane-fusion protein)